VSRAVGRRGAPAPPPPPYHRGGLRGLSGVLVGGLVALTLALVAAEVLAPRVGTAGPGATVLAAHVAAATVTVLAQRWVDRRPGPGGAAAAGALAVVTTAGLALQWLA
jgi:hypothetical protein